MELFFFVCVLFRGGVRESDFFFLFRSGFSTLFLSLFLSSSAISFPFSLHLSLLPAWTSTRAFSCALRKRAECGSGVGEEPLFPEPETAPGCPPPPKVRSRTHASGAATGKQTTISTLTSQAALAPTARPYLEQTACGITSPNKSTTDIDSATAASGEVSLSRKIGSVSVAKALQKTKVTRRKCGCFTT